MLQWLTKGARYRAATCLIVLYALCVLAPPAALAFGDGAKGAHFLTDDNAGLAHVHGKAHVHDDGAAPHHSGGDDERQGESDRCCGLFCLSALAPSPNLPLAGPEPMALAPLLDAKGIRAHGPDSLYRPPDSPLSL